MQTGSEIDSPVTSAGGAGQASNMISSVCTGPGPGLRGRSDSPDCIPDTPPSQNRTDSADHPLPINSLLRSAIINTVSKAVFPGEGATGGIPGPALNLGPAPGLSTECDPLLVRPHGFPEERAPAPSGRPAAAALSRRNIPMDLGDSDSDDVVLPDSHEVKERSPPEAESRRLSPPPAAAPERTWTALPPAAPPQPAAPRPVDPKPVEPKQLVRQPEPLRAAAHIPAVRPSESGTGRTRPWEAAAGGPILGPPDRKLGAGFPELNPAPGPAAPAQARNLPVAPSGGGGAAAAPGRRQQKPLVSQLRRPTLGLSPVILNHREAERALSGQEGFGADPAPSKTADAIETMDIILAECLKGRDGAPSGGGEGVEMATERLSLPRGLQDSKGPGEVNLGLPTCSAAKPILPGPLQHAARQVCALWYELRDFLVKEFVMS